MAALPRWAADVPADGCTHRERSGIQHEEPKLHDVQHGLHSTAVVNWKMPYLQQVAGWIVNPPGLLHHCRRDMCAM
jgi:hypothetical protein